MYNRLKQKEYTKAHISEYPIWDANTLPTDEDLKRFEKEPYTTVAIFRLMAGIPADPRICPDDLAFELDVNDIVER